MLIRVLLLSILLVPAEAAVTVKDEGAVFILANGFLTAQVNKQTGDLSSLKVDGLELMGYGSGHHAGYWEQNPSKSTQLTATRHHHQPTRARRGRHQRPQHPRS